MLFCNLNQIFHQNSSLKTYERKEKSKIERVKFKKKILNRVFSDDRIGYRKS